MGQIRSNVVKKQRNWHYQWAFSYFALGIHLRAVVIETPEWKLKAKRARNTTF